MIENNDHVTKERRITYIAKRRMIMFQESNDRITKRNKVMVIGPSKVRR